MCMIFVPGLDVKGEKGSEKGKNGVPGLSKVHGTSKKEDFKRCVESIHT